jgi:hypothetical protein
MLFNELKQKSGMTLTQLANYFGVPYRTIQNWSAGVSQCPDYLMKLFVYRMEQEGILFPKRPVAMYETEKAVRIKVILDGDVTQYAKSFLAIYNNVKSDPDLHKVYNDYDNGVYLVCKPDVEAAAVKFLAQFGAVVSCTDVRLVKPYIECFEYPDDIDVEFLEFKE